MSVLCGSFRIPSFYGDFKAGASKVEDARHIRKPPDADPGSRDSETTPASKADLEEFLDDLLG